MKETTGWVQRMKQMQETGIAFNNKIFADTCHKYQSLDCWDFHSQQLLKYISTVQFSFDGSFLVTGSASTRVLVWPIGQVLGGKRPEPIAMLDNELYYGGWVSSVAISQDYRRIFSSSTVGNIVIHDLERYEYEEFFFYQFALFNLHIFVARNVFMQYFKRCQVILRCLLVTYVETFLRLPRTMASFAYLTCDTAQTVYDTMKHFYI